MALRHAEDADGAGADGHEGQGRTLAGHSGRAKIQGPDGDSVADEPRWPADVLVKHGDAVVLHGARDRAGHEAALLRGWYVSSAAQIDRGGGVDGPGRGASGSARTEREEAGATRRCSTP